MVRALIFDWGGTIMTDHGESGPMYLWKEVGLEPGVERSVVRVPGMVTCIATNAGISGTAEMILALKRVGADTWFSHFFSSKDLGYAKPDPRFFSRICDETGLKPEECIMIGNDYDKDICGAKLAGMRTVFYRHAGSAGEWPMADAVTSSMADLPELIKPWL